MVVFYENEQQFLFILNLLFLLCQFKKETVFFIEADCDGKACAPFFFYLKIQLIIIYRFQALHFSHVKYT